MKPSLNFLSAEAAAASPAKAAGALIVFGAFLSRGKLAMTPSASRWNAEHGHGIKRAFARGTFDAKPGSTMLLAESEEFPGGAAVVGLGEIREFTPAAFGRALAKAAEAFAWAKEQAYTVTEWLPDALSPKDCARIFAASTLNALTERATLATERDGSKAPRTKKVLWLEAKAGDGVEKGLKLGAAVAEGERIARGLADLPGNVCTPEFLAAAAEAGAKEASGVRVTVMDEKKIAEAGMGALLSVAKGSAVPPRFVAISYEGGKKGDAPIAFVGKGLTFDAGGISLKPASGMADMIYDMSGAAAVIGTVFACARAGLKVNLLGVFGACENLPSGSASKPGDVVKSYSGKTIEILNTDCEGRMVLADALAWTAERKPAVMIDAATLTGACCVALGDAYSGLFCADRALADEILAAGRDALDEAWPLPMGPAYAELMKSNAADIANQASKRWGGASSAAAFLSVFAGRTPWAHLDVAGTANTEGRSRSATGRPVPLFMQFVFNRLKK